MNIEAIIRFADLDQRRKDLETDLDAVKEEIKKLEETALTEMADEGVMAVKVKQSARKEVVASVDVNANIVDIEEAISGISGVLSTTHVDKSEKEVSIRVDRKIWASAKDCHDVVAEEFRSMGMDEFITTTVNGARLSSWVRETFDPDNCTSPDEIAESLPEGLRGRLTISEVTKLRAR